MSGRPLDILCMGEPLIEFMRAEDREIGTHYLPGIGGDTSNAAIAAARQGARAGYLTALGEDGFGDRLIAAWESEGVDASRVLRKPAPTGIYFVDPHPSGRRFTYYRAGSAASLYAPEDVPAHRIADARVLHLSGITQAIGPAMRAAAVAAMQAARGAGTLVSYDTNLRLALWPRELARETIDAALAMTDIAFPSIDEATELWALEAPDSVLDHLLGLGPRIVALKLGARGAIVATRERREHIPPIPSEAVDSTGAGDAFAGGFLAEYLVTDDPFAAARHGARVAAATVAGYGAVAPIPRREALTADPADDRG